MNVDDIDDSKRDSIERLLDRPVTGATPAVWGFTNRTDFVILATLGPGDLGARRNGTVRVGRSPRSPAHPLREAAGRARPRRFRAGERADRRHVFDRAARLRIGAPGRSALRRGLVGVGGGLRFSLGPRSGMACVLAGGAHRSDQPEIARPRPRPPGASYARASGR